MFNYLAKGFKAAFRSVRFNIARYIPFFCTMLIVESCFGVLFGINNYARVTKQTLIEEEYSYHAEYNGLDGSQYAYIVNASKRVSSRSTFEIVGEKQSSDKTYTIFVLFDEPASSNCVTFENVTLAKAKQFSDGEVTEYHTELLTGSKSETDGLTVMLSLIFSAITLALLTVLFIIRINNYRFEYGIYMTCGADFKKLSENSIFEIVLVAALSYIPSMVLSCVISSIVCGGAALPTFGGFVLVIVISSAEGIISVFFPMFVVSKIYPAKNIASADNSDYVISPRVSYDIFEKSISDYQRLSTRRFAKYFLRVTVAASSFAVCACALYYMSYISAGKLESESAQFTLTFTGGEYYTDEVRDQIEGLDGVTALFKEEKTDVATVYNVVAFDGGITMPLTSGCVDYTADGHKKITDSAEYIALDSDVVKWLERYSYEGDLSLGLEDGYCVIVCNRNNLKALDIHPGDKIYLGEATGRNLDNQNSKNKITKSDLSYLTGTKLLRAKMKFYTYTYTELTVAAVISDMPTGQNIPIYLNDKQYNDFAYLTGSGETVNYSSVDIYVDENCDTEALDTLLRDWAGLYGNVTVTNNHYTQNLETKKGEKRAELYEILGALAMLSSPVVWAFSVSVFYGKRKDEFRLLIWLGGTDSEIRKIHIYDALTSAGLSAVFTAVISFIAILITHLATNYFSSLAGTGYYQTFEFPTLLFIAVTVLSALFAGLAVMVSYVRLMKDEERNNLTDDS